MGAPESAQNNKCRPTQTQHDFPHLLLWGGNVSSKIPDEQDFPHPLCKWEVFPRKCQIILEMIFQIIFEMSSDRCEVHVGLTCGNKTPILENTQTEFKEIFVIITRKIPPEHFLCNVAATGVSLLAKEHSKGFALLCNVIVIISAAMGIRCPDFALAQSDHLKPGKTRGLEANLRARGQELGTRKTGVLQEGHWRGREEFEKSGANFWDSTNRYLRAAPRIPQELSISPKLSKLSVLKTPFLKSLR